MELPEVRKATRALGWRTSLSWALGLALLTVLTGFAVSWAFGWAAFDPSDARELFRRSIDGRADVRRAAAIEWARTLQEVEAKRDEAVLGRWRPTATEAARLASEFAGELAEDADLMRLAAVASILGHSESAEVAARLCSFLETLPPELALEAQVHTLLALRRLKQPCPAVAGRSAKSVDPSVRKAAAIALGASTEALDLAALVALLQDATLDVRWNAAFALAEKGRAESRPVVVALFEEMESAGSGKGPIVDAFRLEVYAAALRAAVQLKDAELRVRLESLAKSHPSVKVRSLALTALD